MVQVGRRPNCSMGTLMVGSSVPLFQSTRAWWILWRLLVFVYLNDFQFSIHRSRSHDYKFFLNLHFFKSCLPILINDFWIYMDIFLSVDCGEYKTSRKQSSILVVFICLKVIFLHFVVVPNAILEQLLASNMMNLWLWWLWW